MMKLYRYIEDFGRMGHLEGLFFLTDEELEHYKKHTDCLIWDELLGKHSEGTFNFSDETLEEIDIPAESRKVLYEALGRVVSGPFDFEFFDEMIEEQKEEEDDETED